MSRALRLVFLLVLGFVWSGVAQASQPSQLLIARFGSNDVVDIAGGGDFSGVLSFAGGLDSPTGLCLHPDGRILVAEVDTGTVTDITGGGDFSLALPFASGLGNPVHLVCNESQILVAELTGTRVVDITAGGDFAAAPDFATLPDQPVGLFEDASGRIWVTLLDGRLYDITGGGDFSVALPFANASSTTLTATEFGSLLLLADNAGGRVIDASAGGDVSAGPNFATGLPDLSTVYADPVTGDLLGAQNTSGNVWEISAGGDFTAVPPFAFNLGTTNATQFARIPGCGDTVVQANETCDDGNLVGGDGCGTTCQTECFTDPIPASCTPASPGDVLATFGLSVYEIRSGGDVTDAAPFATGILTDGLCATPAGQVFSTDGFTGGVVDITRGGDFAGATPFATGLSTTTLWCDDTGIFAASVATSQVFDISAGGDFVGATPFATLPPAGVYGLFRASDGTFYASTGAGDIFDITAGGDLSLATPFATNGGGILVRMTEFGGRNLVSAFTLDRVIDFTAGGDLSTAPVFANVTDPSALGGFDGLGQLFVADITGIGTNGYHEISAGGDFTAATPYAMGPPLSGFEDVVLVPGCGDGIVVAPEQCDDANEDDGDGCNSLCMFACTSAPQLGCVEAAKGSLLVNEKKVGKEKWKASLKKLMGPTVQGDFGDPVTGATRYDLCLYDGAGALVGEALVDRAGDTCGAKAKDCWKAKSDKGYQYKDPDAASAGIKKIQTKSGDAGKGKVAFDGGNNSKKGQTALPTGVAGALAGSTGATVQAIASDGVCTSLDANTTSKDTGTQFKAVRK